MEFKYKKNELDWDILKTEIEKYENKEGPIFNGVYDIISYYSRDNTQKISIAIAIVVKTLFDVIEPDKYEKAIDEITIKLKKMCPLIRNLDILSLY